MSERLFEEDNNGAGEDDDFDMPGETIDSALAPPDEQQQQQQQQQTVEERVYIKGTKIELAPTLDEFRRFFETFSRPGETSPLYMDLCRAAAREGRAHIDVDCADVRAFSPRLYELLVGYPSHIVMIMESALNEVFAAARGRPEEEEEEEAFMSVRPFHVGRPVAMRDLGPDEIDFLVSVSGMVVRTSSVIPDMSEAFFECAVCHDAQRVPVDSHSRVAEPTRCANCSAHLSMEVVHNRCTFRDKQIVRLQETPESIPEGETPQTVSLFVYDSMVDAVKPGDRVVVTGIFRAEPVRASAQRRVLRTLYKTFVDVLHFERNERAADPIGAAAVAAAEEGGGDDSVARKRRELEERMRALGREPGIYARLVRSLAPSVWEMEDEKRGILCQLFGGAGKTFRNGQTSRSEVNILLCGDPGTSKSQLLKFVHKVAERGQSTSGKGSSAVGLTAYVTRDPDTRDAVLESGALVLSDQGVCCIDEFDKMSDYTRAVLHEVMEQQTLSVAKSGVVCTLNARTAILAAANPRESRYNPRLPVHQNINLPPTLLSRFDLIFLVLDKPDETTDSRLGRHIVELFSAHPPVPDDVIPVADLRMYISYARAHCSPRITDAARAVLVDGYVAMRRQGAAGVNKTVTATVRQLTSLIRISEALARMQLRDSVDADDAHEAIRLVRAALQSAATDPLTGAIDMDLITTGHSAAARVASAHLAAAIRTALTRAAAAPGRQRSWSTAALAEMLRADAQGEVQPYELHEALNLLRAEGFLDPSPHGTVRIASKAVD